ncbi:MAG: TIGR01777 family oxidoreductase [Acidobacteria bacterium]|nr:TIGR01777 family oxidoreductase [Acidobacteriota bacterium]
MNILITGASGLIGSTLSSYLIENNHRVLRMVRKARSSAGEVRWDPSSGILDMEALEGLDAVVHLAGENIASGRWSAEKKRRIRDSRIQGTRILAQSLARLFDPPKVLVSASATGYYGDRGDEILDEESAAGTGFLASLCSEWEAATEPAVIRGIRVVTPRFGMVLSVSGGAMAMMLPVFRLGIGGRIGNGRQYMSWIAIDDLVGIIDHAIRNESLSGPINAVAPSPVTNREFTAILGHVLSKPAFFVLPAFAARIAFGKMAEEVLLASARVLPTQLKETGYKYKFPDLEEALRHVLQPPAR